MAGEAPLRTPAWASRSLQVPLRREKVQNPREPLCRGSHVQVPVSQSRARVHRASGRGRLPSPAPGGSGHPGPVAASHPLCLHQRAVLGVCVPLSSYQDTCDGAWAHPCTLTLISSSDTQGHTQELHRFHMGSLGGKGHFSVSQNTPSRKLSASRSKDPLLRLFASLEASSWTIRVNCWSL